MSTKNVPLEMRRRPSLGSAFCGETWMVGVLPHRFGLLDLHMCVCIDVHGCGGRGAVQGKSCECVTPI